MALIIGRLNLCVWPTLSSNGKMTRCVPAQFILAHGDCRWALRVCSEKEKGTWRYFRVRLDRMGQSGRFGCVCPCSCWRYSFGGYFGMGKLEICFKQGSGGGRESIWDEKDVWGLRDFNSPAGVRFHCLTYLEQIWWVKQSRDIERQCPELSLFVCVSVGNPPDCAASNFSSKLITRCQNTSITV